MSFRELLDSRNDLISSVVNVSGHIIVSKVKGSNDTTDIIKKV
jgi:hypothetical protein